MNAKKLALGFAATLAISSAWAQTTGPSGAHYAKGSFAPVCSVDGTQLVSCTGTVIGGVGNTNATATLSATYTGTVQCRNHGGQVVEVKTQTTEGTSSGVLRPSRNGQLVVPPLSAAAPTDAEMKADADCPNGNWTKEVRDGPTLISYVYTLTFVGYTQPFFSKVYP
ncbi:hypothetical protein [Massilia sp. LjRoot122]|uniref:hypothetical protein n=1 Tax=Massilia sp. LjRoot122 TaxID=3342257 RepID=UPI003ECFED3C